MNVPRRVDGKANPLYDRQWYEHKARERRIKVKFGIDNAEYDRLFIQQGGRCALCHQTRTHRLCIDHDHKTGRIRGLLCFSCNGFLGAIQDDVARVVAYLTVEV